MERRELMRLFLGLMDAQRTGAVADTLWMHGSHETIWEALTSAIFPNYDGDLHSPELEQALRTELGI